jgi:hypothetical protein
MEYERWEAQVKMERSTGEATDFLLEQGEESLGG